MVSMWHGRRPMSNRYRMNAVVIDVRDVTIQDVTFSEDALAVDLTDGRSISAPLAWYPRLWHGSGRERSHRRLIGGRAGIHWPALDEDISVEGLILGKPSNESQRSLNRWLADRTTVST